MNKQPIVAIIGRPNVGKSSLFNRLVGQRQAIVSNVAGTTRDAVRNIVNYKDTSFWLVDTAGLQKATDQIVGDSVALADEAIASADLILMVIDASSTVAEEDRRIAKRALKSRKPLILVVNKIDANKRKMPQEVKKLGIKTTIGTSAIHGDGAGELIEEIADRLPKRKPAEATSPHCIALLGRPNVGKSSIFNEFIDKNKAVVSEVAGTTRDVNVAIKRVNGVDIEISDTAGVRKPGKRKDIEHFSWLRTVYAINSCDVAILVIDATEPSVAVDQKVAGLVKEAGKGLIIAINKWDLVKSEEGMQAWLEQILQRDYPFVWWAPLVLTSAQSGHNMTKLIQLANEIIERRSQRIATKELNKIIQTAMAKHPPSGLKNRHPKLNYVTQTDVNPPEFTLFGAHIEFLHWSYKRYLESQLREARNFSGTAIRLVFKSKYKEKA